MNRRTGRTTRTIDDAIQDLFHTGKCVLRDHYGTKQADNYLLEKTVQRLQHEHPHIMREISIDINERSIELNRGNIYWDKEEVK